MLNSFSIPGRDSFEFSLFNLRPDLAQTWDCGLFRCSQQSEGLYNGPLEFWVRSLFSFSEEAERYQLLKQVAPYVGYRELPPGQFVARIKTLKGAREGENSMSSLVEEVLADVPHTSAEIINGPLMYSDVAVSDDYYISYFSLIPLLA